MVDKHKIANALAKFSILYDKKYTAEEMMMLVSSWCQVFEKTTEKAFSIGCTEYARTGRKFPCPANILQAYQDAPDTLEQVALPQPPEGDAKLRADTSARMVFMFGPTHDNVKWYFHMTNWPERYAFALECFEKYGNAKESGKSKFMPEKDKTGLRRMSF